MRVSLLSVVVVSLSAGCVLDRTGQSATDVFRRELVLHATRLNNIEQQFDQLEARATQLEELTRARGQEDIMRMETLEELRVEVANLRGEVEVFNHQYGAAGQQLTALAEDASFRLQWLEDRADAIEAKLKINPPPPPERPSGGATEPGGTGAGTGVTAEGGGTTGAPDAVNPDLAGGGAAPTAPEELPTDADALISRAEQLLAAGDEEGAETALNRFLELHPRHERVAEAMYRRAEAAFNAGDYSGAVLRFQEVIDKHKESPWAAWAMLRQGECFEAQKQPENAKLFYEDVIRLWPKSKAAKEAKKKLDK